jgi:hypothetical protein
MIGTINSIKWEMFYRAWFMWDLSKLKVPA